jgi:hypothetical protein
MNYYYLITGLPDIGIEDDKLVFSLAGFKEEARSQLSADDAHLFDMFYTKFDNQNLLHYLADKEAPFDERGNITKEEVEECLRPGDEDDEPNTQKFSLPYFNTFASEYKDAQQVQQTDTGAAKWENRLTELYYQWAMKCGNKFISDWFEFNLNLNNILAAYTSRKYKTDIEVVGSNEVADSIRTSNQRDFGLTGNLEGFDIIQRLSDEPDLFEREKKIDLLKWQWLDEQTFFKYFSIERVFAYLVKLEIIERWVSLDPVEGGKLFRKLIDSLKDSVVNSPESVNLQKNEL